jgi:pyruvate/2-oxoacid:ferredoxin oxidoreductase beta subunit
MLNCIYFRQEVWIFFIIFERIKFIVDFVIFFCTKQEYWKLHASQWVKNRKLHNLREYWYLDRINERKISPISPKSSSSIVTFVQDATDNFPDIKYINAYLKFAGNIQ